MTKLGAVFRFATIGHFFKTEQMKEMLPPFVPARRALIYVTGSLEIALGITVLGYAQNTCSPGCHSTFC